MSSVASFTSERLFYRAIEQSDKDFFHDFESSAEGPLGSPSFAVPVSRATSGKTFALFSSALLGVMICLSGGTLKTSLVADKDIDKGIPIGFMALNQRVAHNRMVTFAIGLAEKYEGNGYAKEAMDWCLQWAFEQAHMHRVQSTTGSFNERVIDLYETFGMRLEGTARESLWRNGKWYDQLTYGLLEHEWRYFVRDGNERIMAIE